LHIHNREINGSFRTPFSPLVAGIQVTAGRRERAAAPARDPRSNLQALTKLAQEPSKRDTDRTLYILDEPTTGLHFADIDLLLKVLHQLRDAGNTVAIIEHNLDVINLASHTGQYLAPYLAGQRV